VQRVIETGGSWIMDIHQDPRLGAAIAGAFTWRRQKRAR